MSFKCQLSAVAIVKAEVGDKRLFLCPPISSSPLHLLRAPLWNMAGRKDNTIGVLSSDRCPCCAFSSHCEQALSRHPHKTWKDLTYVQNPSTELPAAQLQPKADKDTRVQEHVDTYTQTSFPFRLRDRNGRKWTDGAHAKGSAYWTHCCSWL